MHALEPQYYKALSSLYTDTVSNRSHSHPSRSFFVESNKVILKSLWKRKGPRMLRAILKNSKPGAFILSGTETLKSWCNGNSVVLAQGWTTDRGTKVRIQKLCQVLWHEDTQGCGERTGISINGAGSTWYPPEMNFNVYSEQTATKNQFQLDYISKFRR